MARGGARPGAGRKTNSGPFGEQTVARRIPLSLLKDVEEYIGSFKDSKNKQHFKIGHNLKQLGSMQASNLNLPLYESRVAAGYPSPADDRLEASLDLNQHLIPHPSSTFFVRASGNSMINAGINDNDILVVDRSIEPKHGDIVIAALNGELTVKRLHSKGKEVALLAENPEYPAFEVREENDFFILGVVTSVIHQY
ncbi:MAG: translesion error-prone DNA polymerase V autoproteolytic subunit [Alphaproteobacteria bacterium]|nr:translesion error-prone DNA polymerase V autoproteolytic subunit [Alphaproteobacteria bacterium]